MHVTQLCQISIGYSSEMLEDSVCDAAVYLLCLLHAPPKRPYVNICSHTAEDCNARTHMPEQAKRYCMHASPAAAHLDQDSDAASVVRLVTHGVLSRVRFSRP